MSFEFWFFHWFYFSLSSPLHERVLPGECVIVSEINVKLRRHPSCSWTPPFASGSSSLNVHFPIHCGCFPFVPSKPGGLAAVYSLCAVSPIGCCVLGSLCFILLKQREATFVAVWWFLCPSHDCACSQRNVAMAFTSNLCPPFLGPTLPRQNSQLPTQVQNGPSQEELEIQRR